VNNKLVSTKWVTNTNVCPAGSVQVHASLGARVCALIFPRQKNESLITMSTVNQNLAHGFIDHQEIPQEDRLGYEGFVNVLAEMQTAYQNVVTTKQEAEQALARYKDAKGNNNVPNGHPDYWQREYNFELAKVHLELALRKLFYAIRKLECFFSVESLNHYHQELHELNRQESPLRTDSCLKTVMEFIGQNNLFVAKHLANEAAEFYYKIRLELPTLATFISTACMSFSPSANNSSREYVVIKAVRRDKPGLDGDYEFVPHFMKSGCSSLDCTTKMPAPPYMTRQEAWQLVQRLSECHLGSGIASFTACIGCPPPPDFYYSIYNVRTKEWGNKS
jgi:hypothetical protein